MFNVGDEIEAMRKLGAAGRASARKASAKLQRERSRRARELVELIGAMDGDAAAWKSVEKGARKRCLGAF